MIDSDLSTDLRRPCTPSHPAKSAPHHRDFAGTPGSRGPASAVLAHPSTDGHARVGAEPLFWGTWTPNLSPSTGITHLGRGGAHVGGGVRVSHTAGAELDGADRG